MSDDLVKLLDRIFDRLFSLTRSITGPGLEDSLSVMAEYLPVEIEKIPSGTRVFDWTVPEEWHFGRAVLTGPGGEVIVDSEDSNLHVVSYSEPIDRTMSLAELQPHLHSISARPTAVPYVTSYYQRSWGFCLSHAQRERLEPGQYHARIEAEFVEGGVPIGQCLLPGDNEREVLLSSYLCHPSLANNELSGPLVLLGLYRRIEAWKSRRFSYRFLLNPETIGSLCFLHRYGDQLREKLFSGLVLTCLGGKRPSLSYKQSRNANSPLDRVIASDCARGILDWEQRPFTPESGSDERQYGSPGFQLPVGQVARDVYGEYDGYHNSLDTKEAMGIPSLVDSVDRIEAVLRKLDSDAFWINRFPFGEPQLGPRGLYPNVNSPETWGLSDDQTLDARGMLNRVLQVLNYADGTHPEGAIAQLCGCEVAELRGVFARLVEAGMLRNGP